MTGGERGRGGTTKKWSESPVRALAPLEPRPPLSPFFHPSRPVPSSPAETAPETHPTPFTPHSAPCPVPPVASPRSPPFASRRGWPCAGRAMTGERREREGGKRGRRVRGGLRAPASPASPLAIFPTPFRAPPMEAHLTLFPWRARVWAMRVPCPRAGGASQHKKQPHSHARRPFFLGGCPLLSGPPPPSRPPPPSPPPPPPSAHGPDSLGADHERVAARHAKAAADGSGGDGGADAAAPACDICKAADAVLLCCDDRALMCRG